MSNNPSPPSPSTFPSQTTKTTESTVNHPLTELNCDLANNVISSSFTHQHQRITFNTSGECIWATQYPEIQKACYLRRVCQFAPPKELRLQNVTPILQAGPTCGLTALSMLFEGSPSAKTFLELAIAKGYSNNGEMFSTKQLNELLTIGLDENRHLVEYKPVEHHVVGGWMDEPSIKMQLRLGSIFLVPYDPDRDHTPCLNRGHKAHWALIIGYMIDQFNDFYVFARHGKTKNLALWSIRNLARSNANLEEFCQPVGHPNETFILPEGGIGGCNGLRCKFIMIEHYRAKDEIIL
ncbi:actin maturation protease [Ochlerotatus camptorhynchus]|uniref:actin maturation protease n=1 Tax=Ochlerotatus camptorhynchus TaxID=644619 RepID=UPI0031CF7B82